MAREQSTHREEVAPSVIGPDFIAEAEGEEPERVYLPSERASKEDAEVTLEFRRTNDGKLAVLAYTTLEALVSGCGEGQPWVSMPRSSVDEVVAESGADVVLWDATLPADQRRDTPEGEVG